MDTCLAPADREDYAYRVLREFRPIVRKLGFGSPRWDYDGEFGILRVQLDDRERDDAVQIDYDVENDLYSANYCQNEGEWQVCTQGKPNKLRTLKGTLTNWLLDMCEDCCADCEPTESWDEDEYAQVPCSHCDDSGHVPKVSR